MIASDLEKTSYVAVRGFRLLREQSFFIEIESAVFGSGTDKQYIVWSDCGLHFRCQVFFGYLLLELTTLHKINGKVVVV